MQWSKLCVGAASSIVVAIACGGKEAGPGDTCGAFFDELVAMFAQCGEPGRLDPSTRKAFVDYCDDLATAAGAGDIASQYAACMQNLEPSICGGPQCAIRGALTTGAACSDDAQCQSSFCLPTTQAAADSEQMCGTCGAVGELGESCSGAQPCDVFAHLYCGDSGTCQTIVAGPPLPTKGQPCTTACTAAYLCVAGVCSDRVGASGACPAGNECQLGLACEPQAHVCIPGGPAGAACDQTSVVQCEPGLQCVAAICEAAKLEGASCVPGRFECATGLVCAGNTCKLPDFTLCK